MIENKNITIFLSEGTRELFQGIDKNLDTLLDDRLIHRYIDT